MGRMPLHLGTLLAVLITPATTIAAVPPDRSRPHAGSEVAIADGPSNSTSQTARMDRASVPTVSSLDYGFLYWPGNHWYTYSQYQPIRHVRTGYYGLALDVTDLSRNSFSVRSSSW